MDGKMEGLLHLVRTCGAELGLSLEWRDTGGVCDGNNIAACGVPVVDTMGVRGGSIHSDQEYLITASLVEQMGSRIRVESQPGRGSKFTFTVPIAKD